MQNKIIPPPVSIPERIDMPPTDVHKLPGGIPLYALRVEGSGVARVSFVFEAGTARQTAGFSASATANLLSEGTAGYTAEQLAERLDFYGLFYDVGIDRDSSVVTFCTLTKFFDVMMELAAEVLLRPAFEQHEVDTYRAKRKQQLLVERSKVSFRSRELFAQSLFGAEHPYGSATPAESYDTLTRDDIVGFYKNFYGADNCFVVCSGDLLDGHIEKISRLAGSIPVRGVSIEAMPRFPEPVSVGYAFAQQPGAVQSAIRMGRVLFNRTHPDFVAMQVLTTILGGYFGSRLIKNLREERGYTYGIFAAMVTLQQSGYMAVATEVAAEATSDAIVQIKAEMERLRTEEVDEGELSLVKNIVAGEVMRILDGPFGIADVTIENIQNGTDNSYLDRFLDEVRSMTPRRIMDVAQKYLDPDAFTVAVVGPAEAERH